jgi:hypothetical protein
MIKGRMVISHTSGDAHVSDKQDKLATKLQGDSGGKINILGGDSVGNCEKKVHMNMCAILNGYRDTAV